MEDFPYGYADGHHTFHKEDADGESNLAFRHSFSFHLIHFFSCSTINPNVTSYAYFLFARSSRTKKTSDSYREGTPLKML